MQGGRAPRWSPAARVAEFRNRAVPCRGGRTQDMAQPDVSVTSPAFAVYRPTRYILSPGIHVCTIGGAPSLAELRGVLDGIAKWLASFDEPILLIVDLTGLTISDAPLRGAYGKWRGDHKMLIKRAIVRAGYVADGAVWRGVLTAIFWIAQPVIPVKIFATEELAHEWLKSTQEESASDTAPGPPPRSSTERTAV